MTSREEVLRQLTIGARVAEEEADELEEYFVETDQFRRIVAGEVDIVFGPKGSGKSAIYSSVLARATELFDTSTAILLVAGENPKGTTAFAGIIPDPPTSEDEFRGMWKLYVLSLINEVMTDYAMASDEAKKIRIVLAEMGLIKGQGGLSALVHRVTTYLNAILRPQSIEAGVSLDPSTGAPTGLIGKIILREPSNEERAAGFVSVDHLIELAETALSAANIQIWILFDRLDVAFEGSDELEANALRSLFRVYLDLLRFDHIHLKIFMRSDIWNSITSEGFREASHITRTVSITWTESSLLNLVVKRLVKNPALLDYLNIKASGALVGSVAQRAFFDMIVPDQIDPGSRRPKTYEWMIGRAKDGTGNTAPRELIHLLTESRNEQLAIIERGQQDSDETFLLTREAIRGALPKVSQVRLEQTLYAEYPQLKPFVSSLDREKSQQNLGSLAEIWQLNKDEARTIATRLCDIGFFEPRGEKTQPFYWVPFLYRPALNMTQGAAE